MRRGLTATWILYFVALSMFSVTGANSTSTTNPMTVTIDFDSLCPPVSSPPNTNNTATITLALPATCGQYTFASTPAGPAQVTVFPDSSNDKIVLNVKISRGAAAPPDLHMTFTGTNFEAPPSGSTNSQGYRIIGSGNFKNGVLQRAPGSNLIFEGWVNDTPGHGLGYTPPTSTAVPVAIDGNAGNGIFTNAFAASVWSAGTLGTPRTLKGELWVHLAQSNHNLTITSLSVEDYQPARNACAPIKDGLRQCRKQTAKEN